MIEAIKLVLKENTLFDLFFNDGSIKRYDILTLAKKFPQLNALKDRKLFLKGHLIGGGVIWNDPDLCFRELFWNLFPWGRPGHRDRRHKCC